MNKRYTIEFTLTELIMAVVIIVQLIIIGAIAHEARVAQAKSFLSLGMMERVFAPHPPMLSELGGTNQ